MPNLIAESDLLLSSSDGFLSRATTASQTEGEKNTTTGRKKQTMAARLKFDE